MTSDKKERMRKIIRDNTFCLDSDKHCVGGSNECIDQIFTAFPSLSREPLEEGLVDLFLSEINDGHINNGTTWKLMTRKNLAHTIVSHFSAPGRVEVKWPEKKEHSLDCWITQTGSDMEEVCTCGVGKENLMLEACQLAVSEAKGGVNERLVELQKVKDIIHDFVPHEYQKDIYEALEKEAK